MISNRKGLTPQTTNFTFLGQCPVNIGDYLYGIVSVDTAHFNSPCPICNNTEKVVIKGKEFRCPNCSSGNYNADIGAIRINVNNYVVLKFKVSEFTYKIDSEAYEPKNNYIFVSFQAFAKKQLQKYSSPNYYRTSFGPDAVFTDKVNSLEELLAWVKKNCSISSERFVPDYNNLIFRDYSTAVAVADDLNKREQEKLRKFNEEHGTEYSTTFVHTHDKPYRRKEK